MVRRVQIVAAYDAVRKGWLRVTEDTRARARTGTLPDGRTWPWNALELWLLEQHTETGDPRYQDAAQTLLCQRVWLRDADAIEQPLRNIF